MRIDVMPSQLKDEFEFYLAHQAELVDKYKGRFVVIKDDKIIGVYDDEIVAITETQKDHELGTFLVQRVEPGEASYTQTYHSRVAF